MRLFVSALGLVLIVEGLPYFISPRIMQAYALRMATLHPAVLRVAGFVLMWVGLGLLYAFLD